MANIKFSQFTEKTTLGTVDFLVGYTGAENVQISPTNLLSTFVSGGGTNGQVAYFDPSNNLAGENDFFWDYTNNRLGIGTITPSAKLHVVSSTAQQLYLSRTGAISGTYRLAVAGLTNNFYITDIAQGQNRFMISASGNIGIGTDSPVSKLDVIGGVTAQGTLIATGISQLGSGGANVYLTSSSAGNVGIGTSSPTQKLHVDGNQYINGDLDIKSPGVGNSITVLQSTSGNAVVNIGESAVGHGFLSLFEVAVGDVIKFDANANSFINRGNFGIGTTSPSDKLTVNGNLSIFGNKIYNGSGANSAGVSFPSSTTRIDGFNGITFNSSATTVGSQSERMRIANNGNVGIGNTNPQNTLHLGDNTTASAGALRLDSFVANQYWKLEPGTNTLGIKDYDGNSLLSLNGSDNSATFAADIRVGGWVKGVNGTNTLYSATSLGTYLQSPTNSGTGSNIYFRNTSGTVFQTFSQVAGGTSTFEGTVRTDGYLQVVNASAEIWIGDSLSGTDGGFIKWNSTDDYLYIGNSYNSAYNENIKIDNTGNTTFAGSATIRKSDLGGSTAMADGTLVLGAGTTDYFSFRLDSGADLYFDKVYGGVAANVFSIDRSTTNGDITFAGDVTVNSIFLPDNRDIGWNGGYSAGKPTLAAVGTTMKMFPSGSTSGAQFTLTPTTATFAGQVLCNTNTTSPAGGEAVFYKSSAGAVLSGFQAILETGSAGSRATALVLDSNQNLLVGKTASDFTVVGAELRANGQCVFTADGDNSLDLNRLTNNGAVSVFRQAGTVVGTISVTGSATAYNTSSDYRLKEDLQDFAGLDMISKIAVYDFKWKESEIRSYGVIAHELQEVLSEAVNGEKDAEQMQGVDYSKIVPLLIKSIQELKSEIEELKSK